MSCILHIETSTDVCSVALSEDGRCLWSDEERGGRSHATCLGGFVGKALAFADERGIAPDAVAVSSGPGSYTGLRIGVSMAKGVCYGRHVPLIAVPTLEIMAVPLLLGDRIAEGELLCPMIDARRMEVYAAVYDRRLTVVRPVGADIVTATTYERYLDKGTVTFFGNGAAKCRDVIRHPNARFVDGVEPLARWMMPIAERRMAQGLYEDTAYFVPFYLKAFVATKARDPLGRSPFAPS